MSLRRRILSCNAALLMLLLCSVAAVAQFNGGLEGTVSDATGAVVSGAKITITNQETPSRDPRVSVATPSAAPVILRPTSRSPRRFIWAPSAPS